MVNMLNEELRRLETETFEVVDMTDLGFEAADVAGASLEMGDVIGDGEVAAAGWTSSSCSCSSCCSCSTSSCCSTSTSTGCGNN